MTFSQKICVYLCPSVVSLLCKKFNCRIWVEFALDTFGHVAQSSSVQTMETYRREALKLAELTFLGEEEGFAARIPGFRGLIATGETKRQALADLETALADWIDLALKRGLGLPPVHSRSAAELVTAH